MQIVSGVSFHSFCHSKSKGVVPLTREENNHNTTTFLKHIVGTVLRI